MALAAGPQRLQRVEVDDPSCTAGGLDVVTVLTAAGFLLLLVPSGLVVSGPLGSVGTPAGLLSVGALWLWVQGRMIPGLGLATGRQPLRLGVLVLVLSTLASYASAFTRPIADVESRGANRGLIMVAAACGLALLAADGIRSRARLDTLLRRIVVMGTLLSLIGIVQFAFNFDIASRIRVPGLRPLDPGANFIGTRWIFRRVAGTTGHPIEFSAVITMIFPLAVHYAFIAQGRRRRWWWAAAAIMAAAIPMSISRTGAVGMMAVALVLVPSWSPARRRAAILASAAFAVAMKIVFPGLLGTIKGLFLSFNVDTSVATRKIDYGFVGKFFEESPFVGRGVGTFIPTRYDFLDNQYLMAIVEGGLVGLFALVLLYLLAVGVARGARMRSRDPVTRDLGQTLAASLAVPIVTSATFDFMIFSTARGLTFLLMGCAGALWRFSWLEQTAAAGLRGPEAVDSEPAVARAEPVLAGIGGGPAR